MASSSWPDGLSDYKFTANPSPNGRFSQIAEYFAKTGNGDYYCIACKNRNPSRKFIVMAGKSGSAIRLRRHLKEDHSAIFRRIYNGSNFFIPEEELFSGITEERTLKFLLNLIYGTDFNFEIVLDQSLIELFSYCAQRDISLPSVELLEEAALKKYNEVKACIKKMLMPVHRVSITLDLCVTETRVPFVGIRAHWVDDAWNLCERFLGNVDMFCVDDDEADINLASLLIETLIDFNLIDKVIAIFTNHAKNNEEMMVLFPEALKEIETSFNTQCLMPCLAHLVNQIVQDGFERLGILPPPSVFGFEHELGDSDSSTRPCKVQKEETENTLQTFIGRFRDAILETRVSAESEALYKKLCKDLRMSDRKMLQVETTKEWTSTYKMLVAAWKKRQVLDKMAFKTMNTKENKFSLTSDEWESLKFIIRALSPLHYCIELLRKSNSISASTAISILKTLLSMMDSYIKELDGLSSGALLNLAWSEEQLALLKDTYKAMKEKLTVFDNYLKSSPTFAIASVLDPQMKLESSLSTQRGLVCENIIRLLDGTVPEGYNNIDAALDISLQEELDEYFQEACVVHEDPLTWWRQTGCRRFPRLAVLAKNFLSICPVSTSFPRMFEAGLKTVPHNTISDSATLLMTLKCWRWEEDL